MDASPTTVFVYGTLMPGERNAHVAARHGSFSVRPATLRGYRLFHLSPEGYPGIVPGEGLDRVHGFALTYPPADWPGALPFLDDLEGVHETPPLYTRAEVTLDLGGEGQRAWVYVYARPGRLAQPGVTPLPRGDWRELPDRQERGPDER